MKNINSYIAKMNDALQEKLFFVDKVELFKYDCIIEFGGATGALLNEVSLICKRKDVQYINYDINENMLERCKFLHPHITATNDFEILINAVKRNARTLVIFSSVLHEVINFTEAYWLMRNAHTVVIRDMKRPLNNEPVANVTRKRLLSEVAPWQAQMFENEWGKICDKETMYRFFLMNEYVENFETEVEEDYFSVPWSEITWLMEGTHNCIYDRSFTLPYRKEQVKRRFNYVMNDFTHHEMIFIKKQVYFSN